jgi:hypothetical protein
MWNRRPDGHCLGHFAYACSRAGFLSTCNWKRCIQNEIPCFIRTPHARRQVAPPSVFPELTATDTERALHYLLMRTNGYIGYSERRLIGHSFYRRNFLRKCCATCREKWRRAASRTEKSDKPTASFFWASGAAFSWDVSTVKWMSDQPALWTAGIYTNNLGRELERNYTPSYT